jgi:hypothetical protein
MGTCLNILNDTAPVYKNGDQLTFVIRGRDSACTYILRDALVGDTIDAVYYKGIDCLEHYSNAYLLFRYSIHTRDRIRVSISDGVQGVAFGPGGITYETLEKGGIAYAGSPAIEDSLPEYSCSQ